MQAIVAELEIEILFRHASLNHSKSHRRQRPTPRNLHALGCEPPSPLPIHAQSNLVCKHKYEARPRRSKDFSKSDHVGIVVELKNSAEARRTHCRPSWPSPSRIYGIRGIGFSLTAFRMDNADFDQPSRRGNLTPTSHPQFSRLSPTRFMQTHHLRVASVGIHR